MSAVVHGGRLDGYVPPALDMLPGGWLEFHVAPLPQWPVVHRNIRALHGLVTALLQQPHDPVRPRFALAPWPVGIGWRAFIHDREVALRVAARVHEATLFGAPVLVRASPLRLAPAPCVVPWAPRLLVLDTVTPVCVRADGRVGHYQRRPTAAVLLSTVGAWMPRRVGYELAPGALAMELVLAETKAVVVPIGGKLGRVQAFGGRMVLRANALTCWFLRLAETIGLGGRCAFGFGRVRITEAGK